MRGNNTLFIRATFPNTKLQFLYYFTQNILSDIIIKICRLSYIPCVSANQSISCGYTSRNYKIKNKRRKKNSSYKLPFLKETAGGANAKTASLMPKIIGIHTELVIIRIPNRADETGARFSS